MSNVNVKRLVENIRSGTSVYTPLVELVVNAIQAIDEKKIANGLIEIEVIRNEIGRASCRARVCQSVSISVVAVSLKNKKTYNNFYTTHNDIQFSIIRQID